MLEEICMRVGDRRPSLRVVLGLKNAPTDNPLTGASGVTFTMTNRDTGAVKVNAAAATIEDSAKRIVSYAWGSTDTNEAGKFEGFFTVSYGGGIVQSFPATCDGGIPICIS